MPDIARIQAEVKAAGADGWLLYDFHNRDAIAYHVLGMDYGKFTSRRWFYWIPAAGEPIRLCHKVESKKLESLPGEKRLYLSWRELHASLKEMLGAREEDRDAVLADGEHPLRVARGRRHHRSHPIARLRGRVVRGPGADLPGRPRRGGLPVAPRGRRTRAADQGRGVRVDRRRAAGGPHAHAVRRPAVHRQALRGRGPHLQGRVPDRRHQRAAGRPALRADARQRAADQAGRYGPHRPLGEAGPAGRHLLRHHLVRLRRPGRRPPSTSRSSTSSATRATRRWRSSSSATPRARRSTAGKWTMPAARWSRRRATGPTSCTGPGTRSARRCTATA